TGKTLNANVNSTTATAGGTVYLDRALGGSGLNQTITIPVFRSDNGAAQNGVWAVTGRDGYNLTFSSFFATSANLRSILLTNTANGLLTFTGDYWNSTE